MPGHLLFEREKAANPSSAPRVHNCWRGTGGVRRTAPSSSEKSALFGNARIERELLVS